MNTFERIFGWLLMPCIVASILIYGVTHRKAHMQEQSRRASQQLLPSECRKLELKVGLMREELLERTKRFAPIFDTMRITNDTWLAEVKSLISEVRESVDAYLCAVDTMCVDARVSLASTMPSNQWHEARVNSFIDDVRDKAGEGLSIFSHSNLRCLERHYNLLYKHRSLWRVEKDDFVFLNDGLDWEITIDDAIEYPDQDEVREKPQ